MLLEGTTLIVDRYAFSGVAYSAAKLVRNLLVIFHCKKVSDNIICYDILSTYYDGFLVIDKFFSVMW